VLVVWSNDPVTSPYDHRLVGEPAYNNLGDYVLQASAARGRSAPPSSGWRTLARVEGNRYHSRQHLVNLRGANWLRLLVTAGDGSPGNEDAAIDLDVYDASRGAPDSWIFYGDSITQDGMHHARIASVGNFAQLIHAARPGRFPAFEDGGTAFLQSRDGAQRIGAWLSVFPGRYVGLSFGTNDAAGCVKAAAFSAAYAKMIRAVLAARKIPVVPTIPWAANPAVRACAPALNAAIRRLYRRFPAIVRGPDLWSSFRSNPSLIGGDGLHPSAAGYAAYRRQWARAMLATVYRRAR
jgi:lysophospholipase L1-like esterase